MKNNKWSQKGLRIDDAALNGAFWTHKKSRVQVIWKKWNPFVTHQFPYENLILRKRLFVLYTKCIHVLPYPSQLFSTFYVGEMMIPCQLSTFWELICRAFHFQGHIAQKMRSFVTHEFPYESLIQRDFIILNLFELQTFSVFKMHYSKPHHQFSTLSDFICYFSCIYWFLWAKWPWNWKAFKMNSEKVPSWHGIMISST